MTAQDSYEYSTNTGAKLSVGGKVMRRKLTHKKNITLTTCAVLTR